MKVLPALASAFLVMTLQTSSAQFPPVAELPIQTEPPDILKCFDGTPVESSEDWLKKRKPELQRLVQHYEYGFFPRAPGIKSKIQHTDRKFFAGKATLKLATLTLDNPAAPQIHVLLVLPNGNKKPAPVFFGLNFSGNHSLLTDTNIPIPAPWVNQKYPGVTNNRATNAGRGQLHDVWSLEQTIDRGYAVATVFAGEIQPDVSNGVDGVRTAFRGSKVADHDWGTIAAWAWGLHRIVDFLEKEKRIDSRRLAVVGHSRLGKAAILAGAFDPRIDLVIPLQAGCGGTAPARGSVGESVKQINARFPHWFCDEFKKFNDEPARLPFDQHALIALCAPRPVLLANAEEDSWANPAGQFEMLREAEPAYRLLGAPGLASAKMPAVGELMASRLGYFIRPGKHAMTPGDWKIFADYADAQWGRPE